MTADPRAAAVILAAGAASRFGGDKVFAPVAGRSLLEHVLGAARQARLDPIVVVLGPKTDAGSGVDLGDATVVRNPHPADGLSSSLRLGLAALETHGPGAGTSRRVEAAVILLGDQPLVRPAVIEALLAADRHPGRTVVVPRYEAGGGPNPTLVLRPAWHLADGLAGDRGFGPVIAAHPELVVEVPVDGTNPDVDTPADLAAVAWAAQVRANRDQVDRVREVGDGDFYASTTSLFRADPRRPDEDDATLAARRGLARPGERWLDIGAGAGRYALPLALALEPDGEVIAVDPSPAMLAGLREDTATHGIGNLRIVEGRWPLAPGTLPSPAADVALIANVGYDIEAICPFVDAMEAAVTRLCVAVMMERTPASVAEPFWPRVHGEPRIPLPALPEFVALLRSRGRDPVVRTVHREQRSFPDRDTALGFLRRQTWVEPDGARDRILQAELDRRMVPTADGGVTFRHIHDLVAGIVIWRMS